MRFLIIGASGFVGRNVLAYIRSLGFEALGTQAHSREEGLLTFDLLHDKLADRVGRSFFERDGEVFLIVAAVISNMDLCLLEKEMSRRVNVENTIRLIEEACALGAKPIFLSSCFVFDGTIGYYNEDHPVSPINEYGRQKAEVEAYIEKHVRNAFVVRLDKIVGDDPEERQLFASWYQNLAESKPILCIGGSLISPTYVKDVAQAIVIACQEDMKGVFHVSNSEFFYRDELARQFCYALGKTPDVILKPLDEFNFPDKRALKSYLDGSRFAKAVGMRFTSMREVFEAFRRRVEELGGEEARRSHSVHQGSRPSTSRFGSPPFQSRTIQCPRQTMSKTNSDSSCPVCRTSRADIFFESRLGHSVRSDWATLPVRSVVLKCTDCGHLFKPSDFVRACSDYQAYSAWGNSPERDKTDFSLGAPVTRSAAIVTFLRDRGLAPETHAILDYGCNRGAFLLLLGAGGHAGFDVSEQYRSIIESRGYEYFTPGSPPPRRKYDVVTLIHVVEHLSSVADDMKHGAEALKEQGSILVQVPNVATQPTDLYVADHFSHFLKATLVRAMLGARFEPVEPVTSILPGELTGLFRAAPVRGTAMPQEDCVYSLVKSSLDRGEDILLRLKADKTPCLIFGAGFLGSLVAAELEGQVQGFVDDNEMMYTDTWTGLPIHCLLDVRSKTTIVVAVPPSSAVRVAERCRAQGHSVEVPFHL